MIVDIFDNISEIVQTFAGLLNDVFTSSIQIFYNDGVTNVGILLLIGLGTGLLIWGFKFIRRLIRVRTK